MNGSMVLPMNESPISSTSVEEISSEREGLLQALERYCEQSHLYAWSHLQPVVESPPALMYISTSNVCNFRCKVCAWKDAMRRGCAENEEKAMGLMSFDLFQRIVDMIPEGVARVYLMKIGEPMLNPALPKMMKWIKEQRPEVEIAIHTNGSYLHDPELIDHILHYVDFFSISVFALERERYHQLHGRDFFPQLMENLKSFHRAFRKAKRKPKVYFDYVRQIGNCTESDEKVFAFFHEHFPAFATGIHYPFNYQGFGEEGDLQLFETLPPEEYPICVLPWMSLTVLWDGKVDYCFVEPQEKYFLGDVKNATLSEIWWGESYQNFRRMFIEKRFEEMQKNQIHCQSCSWLFGLKTQSAETLALSSKYFHVGDEEVRELNGDPEIKTRGYEYLGSGYHHYLRGELEHAFQDFFLAFTTSRESNVKHKAERWFHNVQKVFAMRKPLELWENHLQRESKSLRELHRTRYAKTNPY